MNVLLLTLPALLLTSMISAEKARVQVSFHALQADQSKTDEKLDKVVDFSDGVQLFTNQEETFKIDCSKKGDGYHMEFSYKDLNGKWKLDWDIVISTSMAVYYETKSYYYPVWGPVIICIEEIGE